ncbi:MAG: SDR family NAD(P)-dependent oxidoreductase [Rouxiella badensis]|uniref:SDR family NAD(P)-dependent oxidoreductase n=1 Tax=Rouxiella badensis TaxID=1646377 RepID=UPI003C5DD89C
MIAPLTRDARGYESQFSTNHLGHFQLTARLFPALRQANGARVVCVSSAGHRLSDIHFEDPNYYHRPYEKWPAYGQSKTANVLFALALDTLGKNVGVRAFSLHPGAIFTPLLRFMAHEDYGVVGALNEQGEIKTTAEAGFKTPEQGAATAVWCATIPQLEGRGGVYCEDCDIATLMIEKDALHGVMPWAVDAESAHKLWKLSEQLTGVTFNPDES